MKQTVNGELKKSRKFFSMAQFASILVVVLTAFFATSCSDSDDEPSTKGSIYGTWTFEDFFIEDNTSNGLNITLTLNKDNTGSIVEVWSVESRASETNTFSMNFSWTTTTDSSGNDIMKLSYISGDKNTEIFMGGENTVLWSRKYVLTGNILNIYDPEDNSVWVLHRQ